MGQTQTSILRETFSEILANLAFMFIEDEEAGSSACETWLETRIEYEGPRKGGLRLLCPSTFAATLSANLLGIEPGDPEAAVRAEDSTKELMNILCGQLVTRLYGTQDVYNLSIPTCRECYESPCLCFESEHELVSLNVDGCTVHLEHIPEGTEQPLG